MAERYDIISPRESKQKDGTEKTFWMKIGAGFKREKGGYSLVFDALPLPDKEGRISLLMVPPKEKTIGTEKFKQVIDAATPEIDDSIPF